LQLVLDSNIYIFGLGIVKVPACERIILKLADKYPSHVLRIPRKIVEEVHRHLTQEDFSLFVRIINDLTTIDEDIVVPFETAFRYETMGLKPADAFIAAYTEWTGSDVLVSENRHFLTRQSGLPFRILTAQNCLKILK
jgi:hypothetical protein